MDSSNTSKSCSFCSRTDAIYTCPRCALTYCSKTCYQCEQHTDCSEQFYKEWIQTELKLDESTDPAASKRQMMDILSKFERGSSGSADDFFHDIDSDDDSIPDLCDRLENVDLNNADEVWNCLTEHEKLEFQTILSSGNITHLIPEYQPWWCKSYQKKIEELDAFLSDENRKKYEEVCPPVKQTTPFSSISKSKPSDCILWNIVNVLAPYTFVVRRYIGEHLEYSVEATNIVVSVSENLNANQNFETKEAALQSAAFNLTNNQAFSCSKEDTDTVQNDVTRVLAGPEASEPAFYLLSALSDLHLSFSKSLSRKKGSDKKCDGEFSKKFPNMRSETANRDKVHRAMKKLEFYLSWTREHYKGVLVAESA